MEVRKIKTLRHRSTKTSGERNRRNGGEVILDERMAENLPTLIKNISS